MFVLAHEVTFTRPKTKPAEGAGVETPHPLVRGHACFFAVALK
jgi:hypothetical protein